MLLLLLVVATGCHSHRTTVRQEAARYQRAILDSTAVKADTLRRVDSARVEWLQEAVVLEWDSVDYHLELDSAGRVAGVSGKRVSARRSGVRSTGAVQAAHGESRAGVSSATVLMDSVGHEVVEERHSEANTEVANPLGWLERVFIGVILALAVGGVIHLRELTEKWSKRR